jgi:FdhE protein
MAQHSVFKSEDIKKAATALRKLRPAYSEMLDFYEKLFVSQEDSKDQIDIAPIQISDEMLAIKASEKLPLIDSDDFVIELDAASKLCITICETAQSANQHLAQSAQALLDLIDNDLDLKALFPQLLQASTAQIEEAAKQLDIEQNILAFFIYSSMNPSIRICAEQLSVYLDRQDPWQQGYCPICGNPPVLSILEDEGKRSLICSFCWHAWPVKRGVCPFCDRHDSKSLGYFFSEEENEYRVYTCDNCKKYIKTIDTTKIDRLIYPPLEQVVTLHLDIQADQKGFESGLMSLMSV